jgi:predicted dehydrogenase
VATPPTVRWGILGTGRITVRLVRAIGASEGGELVAVASRDTARAAAYARTHGIPRSYGSYEGLLADPDIDALYIALPNHLHTPWTVRALDAGKHVLCEKPIAISLEEMDELDAAARRSGRLVAEAYMALHHAQNRRALAIARSGALGVIRFVRGSFSFDIAREDDARLDPAMAGGCLWDLGGYVVNMARRVAGSEPVEVQAMAVVGRSGVDERFVGQLRFADGILAQLDCSFRMPDREYLEVVGSRATLTLAPAFLMAPDGPSAGIRLRRGAVDEHITIEDHDQYRAEFDDFHAAIDEGRPPLVDLGAARGTCAVLVRLLEAAGVRARSGAAGR